MVVRARSRAAMVLQGVPVSLLGKQGRISPNPGYLGQYRATKHDFWLRVSFSEYQDDSNEVLVGLPGEVLVVPLPEFLAKCSHLQGLVHF